MYGLRPLVASPTGPCRGPARHSRATEPAGVTCDSTSTDGVAPAKAAQGVRSGDGVIAADFDRS
jgi:hypothetical protein